MTNNAPQVFRFDEPGVSFEHSPTVARAEAEKESTRGWQIRPPIITTGRLKAVKMKPVISLHPEMDVMHQNTDAAHVSQETSPLFEVTFVGPDQHRYSVSARVEESAWPSVPRWAQLGGLKVVRPDEPTTVSINKTTEEPPAAVPRRSTGVEDEAGATKAGGSEQSFILQVVQPGLAGLMDGSVSTLAPIFAVAFATHQSFTVFLVGMASALGAGISMAFSEALSDDGKLTGRGSPLLRGGITGLMTFLSGAGHALPFLIANIQLALIMAYFVVAVELLSIAAIRHRFFGTAWLMSIIQVVGGGLLVFLTALLLGNA